MVFEKVNNGDIIKIKNTSYQVLFSQVEADISKPPEYKVRTFKAIYLHIINSKSIQQTHQLHYYSDKEEILLFDEKNKNRTKIDVKDII